MKLDGASHLEMAWLANRPTLRIIDKLFENWSLDMKSLDMKLCV
jgi:hypothetical protein